MLATDWSRVAGVPPDLVRAAYGLSGVYDLAPLIGTSLNEALGLSTGPRAGREPHVPAGAAEGAPVRRRRGRR